VDDLVWHRETSEARVFGRAGGGGAHGCRAGEERGGRRAAKGAGSRAMGRGWKGTTGKRDIGEALNGRKGKGKMAHFVRKSASRLPFRCFSVSERSQRTRSSQFEGSVSLSASRRDGDIDCVGADLGAGAWTGLDRRQWFWSEGRYRSLGGCRVRMLVEEEWTVSCEPRREKRINQRKKA
jgi:hypothetical protein